MARLIGFSRNNISEELSERQKRERERGSIAQLDQPVRRPVTTMISSMNGCWFCVLFLGFVLYCCCTWVSIPKSMSVGKNSRDYIGFSLFFFYFTLRLKAKQHIRLVICKGIYFTLILSILYGILLGAPTEFF